MWALVDLDTSGDILYAFQQCRKVGPRRECLNSAHFYCITYISVIIFALFTALLIWLGCDTRCKRKQNDCVVCKTKTP